MLIGMYDRMVYGALMILMKHAQVSYMIHSAQLPSHFVIATRPSLPYSVYMSSVTSLHFNLPYTPRALTWCSWMGSLSPSLC